MCKISVIIPVFNVERYLAKCLDSILNQTLRDLEIIIVDDGSKDESGRIADTYPEKDNRVKIIHKENGGAPSARNAGMKIAVGKYFYFPDSDDWIEPDYLEKLYYRAEETKAQLTISGYRMEYCQGGDHQIYTVSVPEVLMDSEAKVRATIQNYFDNMMVAVPWNKLYLASYLREYQLEFPNLKWDDLHFNLEVLRHASCVAISRAPGYHFLRLRPGSETILIFDERLYFGRREQYCHILELYRDWEVTDRKIMNLIYGYYSARLIECVQERAILAESGQIKRKAIREIIGDPMNRTAILNGKISSKLLRIAILPMRMNNVTLTIWMGKLIGFVKKDFSKLYYRLKSLSVNKASE